MALTGQFDITGYATKTTSPGNSAPAETGRLGSSGYQAVSITVSDTATAGFSSGVLTSQCTKQYVAKRTLAGGANDDLDLTALTDGLGAANNFATVKQILIEIDTPDGTKELRVGPQAVANAWPGPFGAEAGATDYLKVREFLFLTNHLAGWAVSGTDKVLRVANPGGTSISYHVHILGS